MGADWRGGGEGMTASGRRKGSQGERPEGREGSFPYWKRDGGRKRGAKELADQCREKGQCTRRRNGNRLFVKRMFSWANVLNSPWHSCAKCSKPLLLSRLLSTWQRLDRAGVRAYGPATIIPVYSCPDRLLAFFHSPLFHFQLFLPTLRSLGWRTE